MLAVIWTGEAQVESSKEALKISPWCVVDVVGVVLEK